MTTIMDMSMDSKSLVGWVANLSDGSTVFETPPQEGQLSPWQQLLEKCRNDTSIKITMLRLQYGGLSIWAMPHQMCDGYFQAREVHRIVYRDQYRHLHGVGSVVGDQVFITWLEFTSNGKIEIKSDVRPLHTCRVHTTV